MQPDEIRRVILDHIGEGEVEVENPGCDGLHFEALVISPKFEGLSILKQHQMVMEPLREAFKSKLHALKLKTRARRD